MTPHTLDAYRLPLFGSRLIEASAGTGKTWTIASLYVRLVLGHGEAEPERSAFRKPLMPAEILVMTFTRAATRELSDRIRRRLLEAARCFSGAARPAAADTFLQRLIEHYPTTESRRHAAWQLATAAEAMDDSAVLTIDAWCQRVLSEQAFDTGSLFDETLLADERELRRAAVHDYWRQHCYGLSGGRLKHWLSAYSDVGALLADVSSLLAEGADWPLPAESLEQCIDQAIDAHRRALETLSAGWAERAEAMRDWLDAELARHRTHWQGTKLRAGTYQGWLATLAQWARAPVGNTLSLSPAALHRLSREGLREARKDAAPPVEIPDWLEGLGALQAAIAQLPSPCSALRRHATTHIAQRLGELKSQVRSFSFADSLARLDAALTGAQGERLRAALLKRYPVALIDEFQDTSPQQYRLFDALYRCADNDPDHALLLIGDPKQSIYRFRGADIYSYLRARAATAGRHYSLNVNHRSTCELVDAINLFFERAEARASVSQGDPPGYGGAFLFRQHGLDPMPFLPVSANDLAERFHVSAGAAPAITVEHDLTVRSGEASRRLFARRCAERIAGWLLDPQAGFNHPETGRPRLRPGDIAVLVRTGIEARLVRRELSRRGLHSVYLSEQDSIFETDEAADLLRLLRAIAAPNDAALLRTALATGTIGLPIDELERIAKDAECFDGYCEQLRRLKQIWSARGVLAMLRRGLHEWELPARWSAHIDGERRLTNVLHLAELLQQASTELDGEQALIRWLASRIVDAAEARADDHLLRLESDADLIRVVTMHKSKGLEYPVVCVPFASGMRPVTRQKTDHVVKPDDAGKRTVELDPSDRDLAQADLERLREDLRLLYVALTRARHALWIGFGLQKIGNAAQCVTHLSAAGHLLGATASFEPQDWHAALTALARDAAARGDGRLVLEPVPDRSAVTHVPPDEARAPLAAGQPYCADFERHWAPASYSLLTRDLDSAGFAPAQIRGRADDEGPDPEPWPALTNPGTLAPWYQFPGGAASGDFVHGLLEWLDREDFALDDPAALREKLVARCQRAGRGAWVDTVHAWLLALLDTRLPTLGARLVELRSRIPEMEFWMPASHLQASRVDALCRETLLNGVARPPLPARQLNGMLMGFADLVFEHGGRYWVLDYKTNQVGRDPGAFQQGALEAEMARHRYDVQAALYLLALHRLLRTRLGGAYVPAQHLGGALYWFVRGIDAPNRGEYAIRADDALVRLLDSLDEAFEPEATPW